MPTTLPNFFSPPPSHLLLHRPHPHLRPLLHRTMAWTCSASTNDSLINNLKTAHLIRTPSVEAAMRAVDRAIFLPPNTANPYQDAPHTLSCAATISAPHMHAMALELLAPVLTPGATALDVGAGSGYLTACIALMLGKTGAVVGIEHVPQLKQFAEQNLRVFDQSLLSSANITLRAADGRHGVPDKAPFNAIHVGAAAPTIPQPLLDQLAPGGLMVIPVGPTHAAQQLILVRKDTQGGITRDTVCGVRYVPLCDLDAQLRT